MKKLLALLCVLGLLLPATISCSEKVTEPENIEAPPDEDPGQQDMSMEAPK